ncbi:MAG TPA: Do family serine endopeptidase [Albidovulum sp.]|uniref:Do family serine endopeptidase n=1 Tax=Albidovulum sp. TaxID=1872424 RepID=UPI002C5DF9C2|nr:Do family serine endopeptidase [Albidovulum sp.]
MHTSKTISRSRKVILAGVSALSLIVAVQAPLPFLGDAGAAFAATGQMSNADAAAAVKPAVVTVLADLKPQAAEQGGAPGAMPPDEFYRRFFGENGPFGGMPGMPQMPGQGAPQAPAEGGKALGSGFVVSADGYIVTNNHVIENASKIQVKTEDGKELDATLVGADAKNDIAVLKVKADKPLPTAAWGDSDALRVGDSVLAIGDPFGIGTTVTSGIVSARGRDLNSGPYDDFIQVDASINHGNSGGPLVNGDGKVVGINTAIYSPNGGNVGLGFAIPAVQAQKVVQAIIENGSIEHGFIGVSIQPVDESIASALGLTDAKGALVASVQDGSPAAAGDLKAGDVVLEVNGTAVDTPRNLSRAIADLTPGATAELTLWRGGDKTTAKVTVGKLGGEEMAAASSPAAAGAEVPALGMSVEALTPEIASGMGLPEDVAGVVVTQVKPDGQAAGEGLREGDVIVSVNQKPVTSAKDVTAALDAAQKDKRSAALLMVQRGDSRSFVAVPFAHS